MVLSDYSEDEAASKPMHVVGGIWLLAGAGLRAVSLLTDRWESEMGVRAPIFLAPPTQNQQGILPIFATSLIYPTVASVLFQLEKVLFFRAHVIRLGLPR